MEISCNLAISICSKVFAFLYVYILLQVYSYVFFYIEEKKTDITTTISSDSIVRVKSAKFTYTYQS